jgi:hypothetical protein
MKPTRLVIGAATISALGCGSGNHTSALTSGDDGGGPPADGGFGDDAGNFGGDGSSDSHDCPTEATLIYVVSNDDLALHSFDPSSLKFTKIGVLGCDQGSSPFAMSVARDGYSWVLYQDGHLFRVSTKDASCTPTSYVPGQSGFNRFGMGFSSNGPNTKSETLFVCWTNGLARIDPTTLTLTPVGAMPGFDISNGCDMTGTGDGRLFAFVPEPQQWVVAQIDKSTSAPTWRHVVTPPIPSGGSWGTSFWGGDLYLYTTPGTQATSAVWRHRPSDGSTVKLVADVGFTIIGAGESTCAPATPPK